MTATNRRWYSGMATTEDWWAVWLGLIMFLAGLASLGGWDLVGWMVQYETWVWGDFSCSVNGGGDCTWLRMTGYEGWHPLVGLAVTYAIFTLLTCVGAAAQGLDVPRFFWGWTFLFVLAWLAWIVGHEAHFAATVNEFEDYGIDWGLSLGGGFSYILALAIGLIIGNFIKPLAQFLYEAAKPEWFIKTAIVYLGVKVGLKSMSAAASVFELALAGAAAAFVAYLLFWPVVYWVGRRLFRLPRDASAVLSSGISICGVSAAIATGGAIRARPILPVAISMLVVVFAMIELIVLPGFYTSVFPDQPIVNGAAMGMTVKTDGADAAAGAILNELMVADAARRGLDWSGEWILDAAIMTKIWIDMFIGLWAFVLAWIWTRKVESSPGEPSVGASEIWFRFPKFVLGYLVTWFVYLGIASLAASPAVIEAASQGADIVQSPMRKMFFMLTFVSIGVITDFSRLRGMGRLAVLYALTLLVFIAPVAYVVAWIFHHGMTPETLRATGMGG